jgi:hypothetical protein
VNVRFGEIGYIARVILPRSANGFRIGKNPDKQRRQCPHLVVLISSQQKSVFGLVFESEFEWLLW